jgi:hypothetical protein
LLTFSIFWVIFALLVPDKDPDSDPGTPLNPDPVRIRNTGGAAPTAAHKKKYKTKKKKKKKE